jgi:hypothetical protein
MVKASDSLVKAVTDFKILNIITGAELQAFADIGVLNLMKS